MATSAWTYWNVSSTDTCTSYDTDTVWVSWNTPTGTSASTVTTNNEVWYQWTSDSANDGTVICNDEIWSEWNSKDYRIVQRNFDVGTAELKADQRRIRVRAKRAKYRAEKAARKSKARFAMQQLELQKAEEKAKELLLDLIGPDQMEVYNKTGRVFVKGREFDWLLQTEGSRCTLKKVTKDKVHDLCIYMKDRDIPKTDQVIGYLLNAKFNEKHLDDTANLMRVKDRKEFEERIKEAASA